TLRRAAQVSLAEAQLVIARRYGFTSWRQLRAYLDVVARYARSPDPDVLAGRTNSAADEFLRLACVTFGVTQGRDDARRHTRARQLLGEHPELARASIHTAAAVGDVHSVRGFIARDPTLANQDGGPHRWPPLLYLTYSRVDSVDPAHEPRRAA